MQRIDVPNNGEIWQSGAFTPKSKLILWTEVNKDKSVEFHYFSFSHKVLFGNVFLIQRGNAYVYMLPSMDRAYSVDNASSLHRRSVSRRSSMPLTANENTNTETTTHAGRSRLEEHKI